jgi:tetratricopeptide (TPR) repeat protein
MTVSETPFSRVQRRPVQGDLIAASRDIAAWMELTPADARASTAHAYLLRPRGRYRDAATALEQAFEIDSAFAPSLIEMAGLARQGGQLDRAHVAYEQTHRHASNETQWFDEWIGTLLDTRCFDEAVRVAGQWCVNEPAAPHAWFRLGVSHHRNDAHAAALEAYQCVMSLDPDHPMLSNKLSSLHYSLGDFAASFQFCKEAIRIEPDSALAWTNASNTRLALREPGKAVIAAERACVLAPGYALSLLALSNSFKEL